MTNIALRPVSDSDLDAIFEQKSDPVSVEMAAFAADDPNDRATFDSHMARITRMPGVTFRVITSDDGFVGTISCFVLDGVTDVTYWIVRSSWGRGIATRALELLLQEVPERPLRARAASDNIASLRVLRKVGFNIVGTEVSFASARKCEIEETNLELS